MIKIYRLGETLTVSKGAYEEYFRENGWREIVKDLEVDDFKEISEEDVEVEKEDENILKEFREIVEEDENDIKYLFNKPVEEFTSDEAKAFAKKYSINISNMKKSAILKEIENYIKSHKE